MLSLCKRWQLSKQINKASTHFYMRRNTHSGALTKTQHQTPVKHTSTEANRFQILFQSFPQLWTLVFCFPLFLIPLFPLLSVLFLCCFCVYLFIFVVFFFLFFFALAHSDASNASRVMQVWLIVSVDWQPTLKMVHLPCFVIRAR